MQTTIGMMMLLICGYFDLSIGSSMLLAGILSGRLCLSGVSVPLTILLVFAMGLVMGAVTGAMLMSLLTNMFNLLEMKTQLQNVVVGLILIAVVAIDGYINLKKMREMGKA